MEEALIAYMLARPQVAALVSNRIYWMEMPQGVARPCVRLTRVAGADNPTFLGSDRLYQSRIQVDCYGLTYAAAKNAARSIIKALNGVAFASLGIKFQGAFLSLERDGYEGALTPDKLFSTSLDFMIWHTEKD